MSSSSRPPERSLHFELATAGRILFGAGSISALPGVCRELGERAALFSGAPEGVVAEVVAGLQEQRISVSVFEAPPEPGFDAARGSAKAVREQSFDFVVGLGGGSAIDLAKASAALAVNSGPLEDYVEVVGRGLPLEKPPLPVVAVPTTAGTGSEVTRNAVLTAPEGVKASLRSPMMLPSRAVVDPMLTVGMPASLTASTGLDALAHLLEAFVCTRANPLTDGFCRTGISSVAASLVRACRDGTDPEARTGMSLASLLGGMALANAGLGAVHGIAAAVGGRFGMPHGEACAALLPPVTLANVTLLERLAPSSPALTRYAEAATMLTGRIDAEPLDAAEWIEEISVELGSRGLGSWGVEAEDMDGIVEAGSRASSSRSNPVPLSSEFAKFLLRAL